MERTAELIIRQASYQHPDAVALTERAQAYYVEVYGGPDTDPLTAADFTPPHGGFLIGYLAEQPVAMGGWLFRTQPPHAPLTAQIRRMFVRDDLRGRGYGRTLLRTLEQQAAAAGAEAIVLVTGRPQIAAVALYRAAGYRDVPPFGHYANAPGAVHLGKRLPQ